MTQEPTPGEKIAAALAQLQTTLTQVSVIARAQGAFGWMLRGDLEHAMKDLRELPTDKLNEVSAAAAAMSALVDEEAARRGAS